MKKSYLLIIACVLCTMNLIAGDLTASLTFQCSGGTDNRSGVAYNPLKNIYYSVNAGSGTFPLETFDANGNLLQTSDHGISYRGAWWNSNTNNFEGTGYDEGIWVQDLVNDSLPVNPASGTKTAWTHAKPDPQTCGDYDQESDEIVYYLGGKVYRYKRSDHSLIGSVAITNLPVETSNLNTTSIVVTGQDTVGVYDYVNRALYLVHKNTGEYIGTLQLEATAPTPDKFKISYANGYLFVYDENTSEWLGYNVNGSVVLNEENVFAENVSSNTIFPNPAVNKLTVTVEYSGASSYSIYSNTGSFVMEGVIDDLQTEIDLTDLPKGAYVLKVNSQFDNSVHSFVKE